MFTRALRSQFRDLRLLLPLAVLCLIGGYATYQGVSGESPAERQDRNSNPENYLDGTLDQDSVDQARSFDEFPVVWLGEEFQGFKLVKFYRTVSAGEDSVRLIYGSCVSVTTTDSPSCVPPVSLIVRRPGSRGGPESIEPAAAGPIETVRGVPARLASGGLILWTGGVIVTVHGNADDRDAAVEALKLANGPAIGMKDIGPGESLEPLGR